MSDDTDAPHARENRRHNERTVRLSVPEMDCRWKAPRIAERLRHVEGVRETVARPRSATVVVTYDPTVTSEATIVGAVERPRDEGGRRSTRSRSGRRSGGCCCRNGDRRR